MKKIRTILCFVLALAMLSGLAGCNNEAAISSGEKKTIVLGICGDYFLTFAQSRIDDFNANSREYVIEVKNYLGENGSTEDGLTALGAELAAGKGPDIIDIFSFNLDWVSFVEKGILEDLYPYFDKEGGLIREDILPSVLAAMEYDGGLYGIFSAFNVKTIIAPTGEMDGKDRWTLQEFQEYAASKGGIKALLPTWDTDSLLRNLCQASWDWLLDYDTGTAKFDSDFFAGILQLCQDMQTVFVTDEDYVAPIVLTSVNSPIEIQYYQWLLGDQVTFMGIPTADGSDSGSVFNNMLNSFAMNAASQNKDGVWEFFQMLLDKDFQIETYADTSVPLFIPSNSKAFEHMVDMAGQTVTYTDENGNEVEKTSRGMQNFEYHAATQEQIEQFRAMVNGVTRSQRGSDTLLNLISTEVEALVNGAGSVDSAVTTIQSAMQRYLDEQK